LENATEEKSLPCYSLLLPHDEFSQTSIRQRPVQATGGRTALGLNCKAHDQDVDVVFFLLGRGPAGMAVRSATGALILVDHPCVEGSRQSGPGCGRHPRRPRRNCLLHHSRSTAAIRAPVLGSFHEESTVEGQESRFPLRSTNRDGNLAVYEENLPPRRPVDSTPALPWTARRRLFGAGKFRMSVQLTTASRT